MTLAGNTHLCPFVSAVYFLLFALSYQVGILGAAKGEDLFDKYDIPREIRQPVMLLFLERMDWQVSAAASGNWFKTVQGFPFNDSDWDWQDATVDFFYDYDKTKKQYVLCDHRIKIARDSDDYRWQCALNGDIGLNFSGKVTEIAGDFWTFVYYDTGSLAEFYFCNKDIFPDVTAPCQIEWDEKGKKILDPYAEKNTIIGTTSILTKNT